MGPKYSLGFQQQVRTTNGITNCRRTCEQNANAGKNHKGLHVQSLQNRNLKLRISHPISNLCRLRVVLIWKGEVHSENAFSPRDYHSEGLATYYYDVTALIEV
jgi:hypothetical protein